MFSAVSAFAPMGFRGKSSFLPEIANSLSSQPHNRNGECFKMKIRVTYSRRAEGKIECCSWSGWLPFRNIDVQHTLVT